MLSVAIRICDQYQKLHIVDAFQSNIQVIDASIWSLLNFIGSVETDTVH